MAITTRLNITFTVLRLTRFLINPGPLYHKITNKIINYLTSTKNLALYFGGSNNLEVINNALFTDNILDRKSFQAFIIKLFKGLISWKANKQNTITTSTTESELLTLSQTTKESLYILRLITKSGVELKSNKIQIQYNNQQIIRLVNLKLIILSTKLKHIDIYND